ncbi:MAG: hypothetical protein IT557_11615 [Alphaproteobacteria bacterium]|nr:hypothetical protein [Alphaproteobacteria bacterium]
MRGWTCGLLALALWAGAAQTALAASYFVYCANERIEVEMRNLEQMRNARGSNVCLFGGFDYLSDAQNFARRNFGGEGARCSCR